MLKDEALRVFSSLNSYEKHEEMFDDMDMSMHIAIRIQTQQKQKCDVAVMGQKRKKTIQKEQEGDY